MFFENWSGILRILVVGPLAYVILVLLLRITGKRTLAKLNAFDLVVTVALGSTLATVLLSKTVALAEGITALVVLAGLQWIIAWLSVRSDGVADLVRSEPTLLLREGRFLQQALRQQRVREDEVRAAVRSSGYANETEVSAVILETDGSLSVIGTTSGGVGSILHAEEIRQGSGDI
ncbi:DUF421 domain-containing protein [Falsirhodobacter sp. alg1]|uniref:DUF421 domain-containing protein n=1 Tax=Falsirhodobacter sp. alg1 TaxID=1472418 RepID=UPI0005EE002F|nr:YetF domain-containing protein [Falsirhodobacter sp. alg1]